MEALVYLVLGLSIWILVPSERATSGSRGTERSAEDGGRRSSGDTASGTDIIVVPRDRRAP